MTTFLNDFPIECASDLLISGQSFLFEMGSEEIPAHMQEPACQQLSAMVEKYMKGHGLLTDGIITYASPRRLAVLCQNVTFQACLPIERKGPLVSLGQSAFEGFCRSAGVDATACIQEETSKGVIWKVTLTPHQPPLSQALSGLCHFILTHFFWPKKMRCHGSLTWVRPLRWLVCLYGTQPLAFSFNGLIAHNRTQISCKTQAVWASIPSADAYDDFLKTQHIYVDFQSRAARIGLLIAQATKGKDSVVHPISAIEENAGLTQNPFILVGYFDPKFLALPACVIETALHKHQKAFCLTKNKQMLNQFIVVTEGDFSDYPHVSAGYERVIGARLADAQFFWHQDVACPLETFNTALSTRLVFKDMGSVLDKVWRTEGALEMISALCPIPIQDIAPEAKRAARLYKADLATAMVGEFPQLQGVMGSLYAQHQGESPHVITGLSEVYTFYKKTHEQLTHTSLVGALLCMADAMDTLVGFFALGHVPSGSKDPMALRRTAHSLIKAMCCIPFDLSLRELITIFMELYHNQGLLGGCEVAEVGNKIIYFLAERLSHVLKECFDLTDDAIRVGATLLKQEIYSVHGALHQGIGYDMLRKYSPDFVQAYGRLSSILKDEQGNILDQEAVALLRTAPEKNLLALIQSSCLKKICFMDVWQENKGRPLGDLTPEWGHLVQIFQSWVAPLNHFFDVIHVNEVGYRSARLSLLRACQSSFDYFRYALA